MSTLHELISRYVAVIEDIDTDTGEVPPEVSAELDALAPKLESKIEALAGACARLVASAQSCHDLAATYSARADSLTEHAERVKRYTLECMVAGGLERVKAPTVTAYTQASSSVVVSVPAEKLPAQYQRAKPATYSADKDAIKRALERGEAIEGAKLEERKHVRFTVARKEHQP